MISSKQTGNYVVTKWVQINCNFISKAKYTELSSEDNNENFYCITCINQELPFGLENNTVFNQTNLLGLNTDSNLENLNFNLSKDEKKFINHIANLILENNDSVIRNKKFCNYYTTDEFCLKNFQNTQYFSIFHLNIHSLQFHKSDLDILLDTLKLKFDIIALSETKLKKGFDPVHDIDLPDYHYESTPTEANKGGTLIYVADKLNYKPRKDLEIYESKNIESTCIELINKKGRNTIVCCIYKHHTITQKQFTQHLKQLLSKISKEKKVCYLAGYFNMNLLHLENDPEIEKYFDLVIYYKFMPLITSPTRIAKSSKTLIDNIFFNEFSNDIISGNLTVGISDHMPQFALIPKNIPKPENNNAKPFKNTRKLKSIDTTKFNQDLNRIDWSTSDSEDVDRYGSNFLHVFEQLLDIHAPPTKTKLTNKRIKQNSKPWVNKDIIKLIKSKDKTHHKYIHEKNNITKDQLFANYKQQKNEITKLIRQSKKTHCNEYFSKNNTNIKKIYGLESIKFSINPSHPHQAQFALR